MVRSTDSMRASLTATTRHRLANHEDRPGGMLALGVSHTGAGVWQE